MPTQLVNVHNVLNQPTSKMPSAAAERWSGCRVLAVHPAAFQPRKPRHPCGEMQPAAPSDAPVEPRVEETQPQMTNGVANRRGLGERSD